MSGMTDEDSKMLVGVHTTIMQVHGSLEDVKGDVNSLKTDVESLGEQMTDVRELIDPDKIKNPSAKGMLDTDREHGERLDSLDGRMTQLEVSAEEPSGPAQTGVIHPRIPDPGKADDGRSGILASMMSALTPQQQLIIATVLLAALVGGAAGERVISAILGGGS
jgi:hypothetical protein